MSWVSIKRALNKRLGTVKDMTLDEIIEEQAHTVYYHTMASMYGVGESVFRKIGNVEYGILIYPENTKTIDIVNQTTNRADVVIPQGAETIENYAFGENNFLQHIKLPNSIKTISFSAFYNCRALKQIELNNGLKEIKNQAFAYTGLESIYIPDTVTTIGYQAFLQCTSLKTIRMGKNVSMVDEYAFKGVNNVEIYVPWSEEEARGEPWEAENATIHYDSKN